MSALIPTNGLRMRVSGTPADLKLDSSYCSPRFPMTITAANKTAMGSAKGNKETDL